ncbi:uncharacterized protein M8220_010617 isoform 1-T1 [Acridotheres tristis]
MEAEQSQAREGQVQKSSTLVTNRCPHPSSSEALFIFLALMPWAGSTQAPRKQLLADTLHVCTDLCAHSSPGQHWTRGYSNLSDSTASSSVTFDLSARTEMVTQEHLHAKAILEEALRN